MRGRRSMPGTFPTASRPAYRLPEDCALARPGEASPASVRRAWIVTRWCNSTRSASARSPCGATIRRSDCSAATNVCAAACAAAHPTAAAVKVGRWASWAVKARSAPGQRPAASSRSASPWPRSQGTSEGVGPPFSSSATQAKKCSARSNSGRTSSPRHSSSTCWRRPGSSRLSVATRWCAAGCAAGGQPAPASRSAAAFRASLVLVGWANARVSDQLAP